MDAPASILVACNPLDGDEIVAALAGDPAAPAVVVCDGGDDALARFVDAKPEVVVVCATLDAGDARTLIGALRGAAPAGTFQIVLVGDAKGPVRNALDAADFAADRFVARPLSAKALRYAMTAGVAAARRGRIAAEEMTAAPVAPILPDLPSAPRPRLSGAQRAVMITPPGGVPVVTDAGSKLDAMLDAAVDDIGKEEVQRRTSGGFAIPTEAILAAGEALPEVTAPVSVHDVPTRPVGELEQRRVMLAATTSASESATFRRARTVPPPPPAREPVVEIADEDIVVDDEPEPRAPEAPVASGSWSGTHELPPGLEAPVVSETQGSFDDGVAIWPAQRTADLPKEPDDWDAPPMPTREPTMILTGTPAPSRGIDVTERTPGGHWAHAPAAVELAHDDETDGGKGTPTEDLIEDDLEGDLAELSVSRPIVAAPEPPPPSGGDFARELRKKMSLMAQRLFRGGEAPTAPPVDVRPPHDFRTEIDLAEIDDGDEHASSESVYDGDATFAGDDHGLPTSPGILAADGAPPPPVETTARTAESGEISRGSSDAAVLIARMFVSEFTGQVVLRRPGAEKVIYFDGGRPVFASSDQAADRMGELLYREGKITGEQYRRCNELVLESGRRMGEILVDKGFLKRRELLPAVRRHVEDIIYSLFAWDAGEYRIVPGDGASLERIRLSRHPAAMVLEGVRRKLDLGTLERLLGPASTIVEVSDRDKAGTVISVADLSVDERGALAGMDGSSDLAHVSRATGAGLVTVYQLAWAMTLLGVASVRRRGGDDDDAPALVGETDLVIDRERVRARHRLVDEADYFALLGVRRDATAFEIRRAYEAARRDFDADAFPPELRAELTVELAEIGGVLEEAFRVLKDDRLRAAYLANLAD